MGRNNKVSNHPGDRENPNPDSNKTSGISKAVAAIPDDQDHEIVEHEKRLKQALQGVAASLLRTTGAALRKGAAATRTVLLSTLESGTTFLASAGLTMSERATSWLARAGLSADEKLALTPEGVLAWWRSQSFASKALTLLAAPPLLLALLVATWLLMWTLTWTLALVGAAVSAVWGLVTWWPVVLLGWPYFLLKLPTLLGSFLTWVLTHKVVYHPLRFERIYLSPSLHDGALCLRVVVENFGFGNPPGFVHKHFLEAKTTTLTVSCSLPHLWNMHAFFVPEKYQRLVFFRPKNVTRKRQRGQIRNLSVETGSVEEAPVRESKRKFGLSMFTRQRSKFDPTGLLTAEEEGDDGGAGREEEAQPARRTSVWKSMFSRNPAPAGAQRLSGEALRERIEHFRQQHDFTEEEMKRIVTIQKHWRALRVRNKFKQLVRGRWGMLHIEKLEVSGIHLSFDMHKSKLNINGFSTLLAKGEVKRFGKLKPDEPMPNQVKVSIIRARGLKAKDTYMFGTNSSDPYVKVKVRSEERYTKTVMRCLDPMYNETFTLFCDDPSAVLHISVYDEDIGLMQDDFLGQWFATLKHLIHKPVPRQWVPLQNRRFLTGQNGDLEIEVSWTYVEGLGRTHVAPKMTALQQLQENSAETTLRMGSIANVINMLKRFPYLLEVEAVVFRNIELHLADLFAGYQGTMEGKDELNPADLEKLKKQSIKVASIQLTNNDRFNLDGKHGHNLWEVCKILVTGISPQVLKGDVIGRATRSISAGVLHSFFGGRNKSANRKKNKSKRPSVDIAPADAASLPAPAPALGNCAAAESMNLEPAAMDASVVEDEQDEQVGGARDKGMAVFQRQLNQMFGKRQGGTLKAGDEDWLLDTKLCAMLEVMKPHSSRLWKLRRLEIKGDSVFYSKCIGESQVLWTRKFDMTNCFDVELEKDHLGKPSQIILRIYSKISGKEQSVYLRKQQDMIAYVTMGAIGSKEDNGSVLLDWHAALTQTCKVSKSRRYMRSNTSTKETPAERNAVNKVLLASST